MKETVSRLQHLCDTVPDQLLALGEEVLSHKPAPNKWSKKEIIGHLIDSAANNHQRFVRGQFEAAPSISYDSDNWVAGNYYHNADSKQLIALWEHYNRHLATVISHIPDDLLTRQIQTGPEQRYTLEFLIRDYVMHLEHHLDEIMPGR